MRARRRVALEAMLPPPSTEEARVEIRAWFAARGGWVPLADFLAHGGNLAAGQQRRCRDLRWLTDRGLLERREAGRTATGWPAYEYRVPA